MSEKSPKRQALERSLADDPTDAFLRYGLAVQCLREGDAEVGRADLIELIADDPDMVAAYQMLGQSYAEAGEVGPARDVLSAGVLRARRRGEAHAAEEMSGLLAQLD